MHFYKNWLCQLSDQFEYIVMKSVVPATKPTNRWDPALALTRWRLWLLRSAPHTLGFIQLRNSCEDLWMPWHHGRTPCLPVKAWDVWSDLGCLGTVVVLTGWACERDGAASVGSNLTVCDQGWVLPYLWPCAVCDELGLCVPPGLKCLVNGRCVVLCWRVNSELVLSTFVLCFLA